MVKNKERPSFFSARLKTQLRYFEEKDLIYSEYRFVPMSDWRPTYALIHDHEKKWTNPSFYYFHAADFPGFFAKAVGHNAYTGLPEAPHVAGWEFLYESYNLAIDKGFWIDGENRNFGEAMALIHTEISTEIMEQLKQDSEFLNFLYDMGELNHEFEYYAKGEIMPILIYSYPETNSLSGVTVELIDVVIRACDALIGFSSQYDRGTWRRFLFKEMLAQRSDLDKLIQPKQFELILLAASKMVSDATQAKRKGGHWQRSLISLVALVYRLFVRSGLPVTFWALLEWKHRYNRNRPYRNDRLF